jgi:hypothetical protein
MKHADEWFLYTMIGGIILLLGAMMVVSAQPAAAQCGTSASSCKTCHETQGKMPVANKGDWHKAHAFGDFCEFCHAGNVQSTDQTEAHTGMVSPLGDVKASCQGCHPDNFDTLAQTYAATLGVTVGAGDAGSGSGGDSGAASGGDSSAECATSVSAPLGGETIDYNLLYAEATATEPLVSNWGNVILVFLILGTGVAFFITAWSWENWGPKVAGWIDQNVSPIPQAVNVAAARSEGRVMMTDSIQDQDLLTQKPELRRIFPQLLNLPPETLAALEKILANPERGSEILTAVSRVDTEVMATLSQISAKDRNLVLALLKGM